MKTVIGIDPGGTTGVAILQCSGLSGSFYIRTAAYQYGQDNALSEILDAITRTEPDAVAIERFVVGMRAARSRSAGAGEFARELVGQVRALCRDDAVRVPVFHRTAFEVKRWATDKRLDAAGLLAATSGMPHARDATRHALFAMVRRGWAPDPISAARTV